MSQQEMNATFNEQKWSERLEKCKEVVDKEKPTSIYSTFPMGTTFRRKRYYDGQKVLVAVLLEYVKPDGTLAASGKPLAKMLLVDGIMYYTE